MDLKKKIAAWDGKSVAVIRAIYHDCGKAPEFTDELVRLMADADCQKGTSWLLKHSLESGDQFSAQQVGKIYALLPRLVHWETKLHILQSMPFLPVEQSARKTVEAFLRHSLAATNKFVRAWAYNGFYLLASQYPEYTEEATQFFAMAMRDEAPSVKARVRKVKDLLGS